MTENKMKPTDVSVESFLKSLDEKRSSEARILNDLMYKITNEQPVMWGPSIIGFGSQHYKYETGREGDMPKLGFSPRKSAITIYFMEGFDRYREQLAILGKYKTSVSCLYINKLADVDLRVLEDILVVSSSLGSEDAAQKPKTAEEYIQAIPAQSRERFDELRSLVRKELPDAQEVLSYGIVGYKIDEKRARVFVSGWKDHVSLYPVPNDDTLRKELKPYIRAKGTLWFPLDKALPADLLRRTIRRLVK